MRRRPTILRGAAIVQLLFLLSLSSERICGMREHARGTERAPGQALHDCCREAGVGALAPDCCVRACDRDAAVRPARASSFFVPAVTALLPTPDSLALPLAPPARTWTASRSSPPTPLRL